MPRWSTAITSKPSASLGITIRQAYQVSGQPWMSRSGGPSPPITACSCSSPASMKRLVNVSANPSGRFGAPETEPCPSGMTVALMSLLSAQRPEGRPHLVGEDLRLLPGCEVATPACLVEVRERRVDLLRPAARSTEDLAREGGEADGNRDRRWSLSGRLRRGSSALPIGPRRRGPRPGQP